MAPQLVCVCDHIYSNRDDMDAYLFQGSIPRKYMEKFKRIQKVKDVNPLINPKTSAPFGR